MVKGFLATILRGAVGFFIGALVAGLGVLIEFKGPWPANQGAPAWAFWLMLLGFSLSGAIGAGVLTWGVTDRATTVRAAIGFAIGFFLAPFMLFFTMMSLQGGGRPDVVWGAIGFGIAYGIAGAIGAAFLSLRYIPAGLASFGATGAASGYLFFLIAGLTKGAPPSTLATLASLTSLLIPFLLGGALFGAAIGLSTVTD